MEVRRGRSARARLGARRCERFPDARVDLTDVDHVRRCGGGAAAAGVVVVEAVLAAIEANETHRCGPPLLLTLLLLLLDCRCGLCGGLVRRSRC